VKPHRGRARAGAAGLAIVVVLLQERVQLSARSGGRAQRGISIASVRPDTPGQARFGTPGRPDRLIRRQPIEIDMKIRRQWFLSITVFVLLLGVLASVDDRVHDSLSALISGGNPVHRRAAAVGTALFSAAQYQGMENTPMVAFVALGVVLFFFMVRS
jgi:hypothetical protein